MTSNKQQKSYTMYIYIICLCMYGTLLARFVTVSRLLYGLDYTQTHDLRCIRSFVTPKHKERTTTFSYQQKS